jgi:Pyridoxamine 5'-phosphate oxidase
MNEQVRSFLERHPDTAMVTTRPDGRQHVARIEVALVGERLRSSGSAQLVRTKHLRSDPRCTLFVFAAPPDPRWMGLDTVVSLIEGPESPRLHVELMRARHRDLAPEGKVLGHDDSLGRDRLFSEHEFAEHIRVSGRLLYDFEIVKTYGNF